MESRIDLDALEAALARYRDHTPLDIKFALPALIAELRELRARTTPEVIGEKHRDGEEWLVYLPQAKSWKKCWWANEGKWIISGVGYLAFGTPTHALPLPPAPEAQ
jgi:hypothetical protein